MTYIISQLSQLICFPTDFTLSLHHQNCWIFTHTFSFILDPGSKVFIWFHWLAFLFLVTILNIVFPLHLYNNVPKYLNRFVLITFVLSMFHHYFTAVRNLLQNFAFKWFDIIYFFMEAIFLRLHHKSLEIFGIVFMLLEETSINSAVMYSANIYRVCFICYHLSRKWVDS